MEKSCYSCRFSDLLNESEPCRTCLLYMAGRDWQPWTKWEPREDDELTRLRAELARLREATRWIPVGERLPEEKTYILIFTFDGFIRMEYYNGDLWFTHWMPLPKRPEVE